MTIQFGSFNDICKTAALVICPLVGPDKGIEPACYSRSVPVSSTVLFQPSTCFVHIVAILMTAIMIYYIHGKYTAVGRKEILMFFWLYAVIELLAIFLDSGIISSANSSYPWFAAVYTGLVAATYTCLVINGFVGFQFAEDGTPASLWFLRLVCLAVFGTALFIAIATFKQAAGFSYKRPVGLWVVYILWPLICTTVYVVSQLILVIRTLDDRWPIGNILFGTAFFTIGQVLLFAFSVTICNAIRHYIDGLFFFTLCMLLTVMMVYKYWDSITREDLEFSVGSKAAAWDVKDPLLAGGGSSAHDYSEDDSASNHHGGPPASLIGGVSGQQIYQKGSYAGRVYPPTSERY